MKRQKQKTIDITEPEQQQTQPNLAVATREISGPLSVQQVKTGLDTIHEMMRECMQEGQDYGKVPGCGDKPGLFQPGAQKLSMMFRLNPEVREEIITDYPNMHRGYRLTIRVTASAEKFADGVGECSTLESKYRYKSKSRVCPKCGAPSIFKSKNPGEGWYCWVKKGGCGGKFHLNDPAITSQTEGKIEHDNPPDFWNTVRKMAFKRGFVHAIINATNTSELWSQDLEDLRANDLGNESSAPQDAPEAPPPPPSATQPSKASPQAKSATASAPAEPSLAKLKSRFLERMKQYGVIALDFFRDLGVLMPNEEMLDFPEDKVPKTKAAFDDICKNIERFYQMNRDKYDKPENLEQQKSVVTNTPEALWRDFPMPFGKHAGVKLADLDKKYLYGLWANFVVETTYNNKPKTKKQIERDTLLRTYLDQAGEHYKFDEPLVEGQPEEPDDVPM